MTPLRGLSRIVAAGAVIGVVANLVVAWTIAARADAQIVGRWGAVGAPWPFEAPEGWPEMTTMSHGYSGDGWGSGVAFAPATGGEAHRCRWLIAGWPRPSLQWVSFDEVPAAAIPAAVPPPAAPPKPGLFSLSEGRPPLRPRWRGLAFNSLMYGAIGAALLSPLLLVGPIRRGRRARRGECRGCGYELAGLEVCPECGARGARPERRRREPAAPPGEEETAEGALG